MNDSVAAGGAPVVTLDEAEVEALVKDFASYWRAGIQQLNDDVLAYFANFRNGMDILKQVRRRVLHSLFAETGVNQVLLFASLQVLTQLLLYYTRFQDIIKKTWSRPPAFTRDIVSTATIMMEIKRYSRTF
jgi:hypothetical protein